MAKKRREYFLQLVNTRTKKPVDDDTGEYQVYTDGTPSRLAIEDAAGATITQEISGVSKGFAAATMTDGQLHFFTNITVSSVDISVLTTGGRSYFLKALVPSQHRVDVDPENLEYVLVCATDDKGSTTTVRPLGFQLKPGMILHDVYVKVTAVWNDAATASNTIDFGRSGDANGFFNGIDLTATGYKVEYLRSTTGDVQTIALQRLGIDMVAVGKGQTQALSVGYGWGIHKNYIAAAATASNNLVQQAIGARTGTVTAAGGKGYVFYAYTLLPTANSAL